MDQVREIIDDAGVPALELENPTEAVVARVFEALYAALFPGWRLELQNVDSTGISERVVLFLALRQVFPQIGIVDFRLSDLSNPVKPRLDAQLHKLAQYAEFRRNMLAEKSTTVGECVSNLDAIEELTREAQQLRDSLQQMNEAIASQAPKYEKMQEENEVLREKVQVQYGVCQDIAKKMTRLKAQCDELEKKIAGAHATISGHREAIAVLKNYVDEDTGQVFNVKGTASDLERDVTELRQKLETLESKKQQLDKSLQELEWAERRLPQLKDTVKAFGTAKANLTAASDEAASLEKQLEAERQRLAALQEHESQSRATIDELNQQLSWNREELRKVNQDWDSQREALRREEELKMQEIVEIKNSTQQVLDEVRKKKQLNEELKGFLDQSIRDLSQAESQLDRVVSVISRDWS